MIDFMVKHPFIAKGMRYAECSMSKEECGKCWENLTQQLNSLGPPIRKSAAWQKVWTDYKIKLKRKLAHNKKELNSTGGGSCRLAYLSSMEEQIINVLSLDRAVPQNAVVFGINNDYNADKNHNNVDVISSQQQEELQSEQQEQQERQQQKQQEQQQREEQHNLTQQTSRKKRPRSEFEDYRREMLKEQTDSLNKIETLFENCNKYLKRISNAVEKKVQMYEKVQNRKETETNLRIEIMELEKKKIELEISKM